MLLVQLGKIIKRKSSRTVLISNRKAPGSHGRQQETEGAKLLGSPPNLDLNKNFFFSLSDLATSLDASFCEFGATLKALWEEVSLSSILQHFLI